MKELAREEPRIAAALERRMRNWVQTQEQAELAMRAHWTPSRMAGIGPYLAVSREAGAGGGLIAQEVGRRLGWEVLDLLDRVAARYHLSKRMLELVDETRGNWMFDVVGPWLDHELIPHEKYVACLNQVVMEAARRGRVVFVGRGAHYLLPRAAGLAVRIVAPESYRVEQVSRQRQMPAAAAREYIRRVDRDRGEFVSRFFHHDIDDPRLYDLVINVERIGPERAVLHILKALEQ